MSNTKIFTVIGNPILHSKSPQVFNAAFKAASIDAVYTRLAASNAKEAIAIIKENGIGGFNVTAPFKLDIMPFLDSVDKSAAKIGAVNMVISRDGKLAGYNTDFIGVINALKNNGITPRGKKAVVLGAGGAGRAAAFGLISFDATDVVIVDRTSGKAKSAAKQLGCRPAPMEKMSAELPDADILVSCVSTKERVINPRLLKKGLAVLDANYTASRLLADATGAGCTAISGLEWFLFQAAAAFRLFTGGKAPLKIMKKALDSTIQADSKSNIALIGFMGAGKSKVGQILAAKMKMEFEDTDRSVELSAALTVSEIFKLKGQKEFRKIEKSVIKRMESARGKVFSCGGGAILDRENRAIISRNCIPVWLWVSPKTALRRISNTVRPLLDVKNSEREAKRILRDRNHLYAQVADMMVSTETNSPQESAERIDYEIRNAFKG
ncbi:MAG: shikimate kinase [Planctomycetota bacterium]